MLGPTEVLIEYISLVFSGKVSEQDKVGYLLVLNDISKDSDKLEAALGYLGLICIKIGCITLMETLKNI